MGCSIQPSPAENIFGFIAASESVAFLIAFFPVNNTKFNLRIMLDFIKCCWHEIIMQDGFDFFEGGGAAPPLGVNKCSAHDEPAGGRTSLLAGEKFPSGPLV